MRHRHAGPQLDPFRPEDAGGEGDPELAADEMRVRHPHGLEPQRLGQLDLLDDLGDRLRGEDTQVEFHAGIIAEGNFALDAFLACHKSKGTSIASCRRRMGGISCRIRWRTTGAACRRSGSRADVFHPGARSGRLAGPTSGIKAGEPRGGDMRFGIFYEHQFPRPWDEGGELQLFQDALDQVELADQLGIDHAWEVEHHFLEEYSHSSAPEVFLAAASQRTKQIRLGHGIVLMPPGYNHPARIAERIATLDLVSKGRVDFGTGESASRAELEGFGITPAERRAMWRETVEQVANMLALDPYPGYQGKYFSMPVRNVVPKPVQKPHPPLWVACSRRETIHLAAKLGIGALTFAFVSPDQIRTRLREFEEAGVDQVVFISQAGNNKHEDICSSLNLFAEKIQPEFKEREQKIAKQKAERIAPIVEKAMKRKREPKIPKTDGPVIVQAGMLP